MRDAGSGVAIWPVNIEFVICRNVTEEGSSGRPLLTVTLKRTKRSSGIEGKN